MAPSEEDSEKVVKGSVILQSYYEEADFYCTARGDSICISRKFLHVGESRTLFSAEFVSINFSLEI